MSWHSPTPGTPAHRLRTTARAVAACIPLGLYLAASYYIPC